MKKIFGLILAVGLMLGALPARAEYPDKAITCIVPFAPGGAADITVRMVADYLSKEIGQPLVIVNKGGGERHPGPEFWPQGTSRRVYGTGRFHRQCVRRHVFSGRACL